MKHRGAADDRTVRALEIYWVPLDGAPAPTTIVSEYNGGYVLGDMTADDSHLYWTTTTGFVKRGDLDGKNVVVLASNQNYPDDIVVNATHVYWTTAVQLNRGTSSIMRCDLDGGNLTTIRLGDAHRLTLSGTNAFWSGDALIWQSSLDGTNPKNIAAGSAELMVADDSYVYWLDLNAAIRGISKAPIAGGPKSLVAVVPLAGLAMDDKFLYYTVSADRLTEPTGVMRLAK